MSVDEGTWSMDLFLETVLGLGAKVMLVSRMSWKAVVWKKLYKIIGFLFCFYFNCLVGFAGEASELEMQYN